MFVRLGPCHHRVCKLKLCFQPDWKILQKITKNRVNILIKINTWGKVFFGIFSFIFIHAFSHHTEQSQIQIWDARRRWSVENCCLFTLNGKAVSKLGHADWFTIATRCTTKTGMLMCYICTEYSQTMNTGKQSQLVTKKHCKWVKLKEEQ